MAYITLKKCAIAGAISSALFGQAYANNVEVEKKQISNTSTSTKVNTASSTIEKVQVTGSRIKRIDLEGPTPLEVITSADIEAAGFNNLTDVLQSLTANSGSLVTDVDNGSTNRSASTINLRGIGDNRTLVLVDGVRVTKFPGTIGGSSNSFDTNVLPASAIEKVEIVHGGASAIYGSDAMGGVVNVILKKNYDGTAVKFRLQDTERGGGKRTDFSITSGFDFAGSENLIVAEYQDKEAILASQREWTTGFGPFHDRWYSSVGAWMQDSSKKYHSSSSISANEDECNALFGADARYVPGFFDGKAYPEAFDELKSQGVDPFSKEGTAILKEKYGFSSTSYKCRFDTLKGDTTSITPEYEKFNLTLVNTWQLPDNWQLRNTFTYYKRDSEQPSLPHGASSDTIYRDRTTGDLSYEKASNTDRFAFRRRHVEYGPSVQKMKNDAWNITSALSGQIAEYDLDFVAAYGEATRNRWGGLYTSRDNVLDIITFDPNDPDRNGAKWYPLDPMSQEHVSAATGYRVYDSKASSANLSAVLSGELVADFFGNGAIDFATIIDYNREVFDDNVTFHNGPLIGVGGAGGSGERSRYAAAAEFAIPLMADNVLSTNIALRYDYYDDFTEVDGAMSPQIDFAYRPTDELMFRARYAETFRAPDLQRISSETSTLFSSTNTPIPGNAPFNSQETDSYTSISSGSAELEEETGKTWNLGMVWEVSDALTVNADYWNVELDGAVTSISSSYLLQEENFALFDKTGQATDCKDLNGPGLITTTEERIGTDGTVRNYRDISCMRIAPINASVQDSRGIDFGFKYKVDTDLGRFSFSSNATYMIHRKTQDTADSLLEDEIETGFDPEWKINTFLSYSKQDWSATLSWYYYGTMRGVVKNVDLRDPETLIRIVNDDKEYIKQDVKQAYEPWHKFNLTGSYRGIKDMNISFGVLNLLDSDPSLDPLYYRGYPYFNRSSGQDINGRQYFVGAEYSF